MQILARDGDGTVENSSLVYSMSELGKDNDLFSMDESTGVLSFKSVPDYESPIDTFSEDEAIAGDNVYEVLLTVSDGVTPVIETVKITVNDVNDNAPVFTERNYRIEEGMSVLQLLATDAEGIVFYDLGIGGDSSLFSIDRSTGLLSFNSVPDYESALDANNDNTYEVLVTASDGANEVVETARVTVEDENDNAPMFTSTSYTINEGVSIVQILAIDDDGTDENSSLTFSISTGGADDGLFSIDGSTGELAFTSVPDYEQGLDDDGDNVYEVLVTVSDGVDGTDDISEVVRVTVEDENDNAPMFTSTSYTINEDVSIVQILAIDDDGTVENSSLVYSMSEVGKDNDLFSMDESTGVLSFKAVPDYENPTDTFSEGGAMGGDNVYELLLTVSDGVTPVIETVKITVNDVNDNAPVFTERNYRIEEGMSVLQLLATDAEGIVFYDLGIGGDSSLFSIDRSTGLLSFNSVPDYESALDANNDNTYEVLVTASDGANEVVETVRVTVEDENDNAPMFTSTSYTMNEGVSIVQILAIDDDGTVENSSLTFSISTGGADDGLFSISSTGGLSFTSVPDYEQAMDDDGDNVYEVLVTVSDGVAGTDELSEVVRVTVEDENDNAPMFTSTGYAVEEGVSIVQILAIDDDGTVENSSLTFSISTGGADDGLFDISSAGELSFKSVPDYEQAEDDDGDNVYEVLVTVSDGVVGTDELSEVVRVTVEDENDNAPMFTSTGYAVEEGVSIVQILARDGDGTVENSSLVYSMSEVGKDNDLFSIDRSTGLLSFNSVPDYESAEDAEGDNTYEVLLTASDGTNEVIKTVRVTVEDVNDNVPEITETDYIVNEGISIVQILARDGDGTVENSSLTFSISTGGADDGLFSISSTGGLSFTSVPDYEQGLDADGDNVYEVLVTVSDGVVGTNDISEVVRVTVEDENDNAPMFTSTSYTIEEGVSIVQVLAGDADGTDENSSLTFSISTGGADDGLFSISSTGELAFRSVPDYEQGLDDDGDNVYEVLVTVSDGVAGTDDLSEVVKVTVEDENDNAPMFTSTGYAVEEGVSMVQVLAGDADGTDENSSLTFSISTGGADDGLFSISLDGELTFTSVPDYEQSLDDDANNIYEVLITVSDGVDGTSDVVETVRVTVEDDNDNAPMFTSTGYAVEEGVSIVQILAGDADGTDENSSLTFSISTGGADDGLFSIDGSTGELAFVSVPDYEQGLDDDGDNVYEVLVTVSDGVVGTNDISEVVRVTVEDDNDNAPMFTSISYAVEEGVSIVQILARDGDGTDKNSSLTFSISTGGADDGLFSISSTGELAFRSVPDYEQALDDDGDNVYEVLVTVSDGVVGTDDISEVVRVTVEDVNDNAPMFTSTSYTIEEGMSIVQVLAIDDDGTDENSSLTFSMSTGGADDGLFGISSTGELAFTSVPDYEQGLDDDGDNVYEVLVTVSDGVAGTDELSEVVRVTVEDVNDNAPMFTSTSYAVEEGVSMVQVLAIDDDGTDENSSLTFSISTGGADDGLFSISSTGELAFRSVPDYEQALDDDSDNVYEVLVTVSDGVVGTDELSEVVRVTVEDVNDNAPMFTSTSYTLEEGVSIVQVLAIDDDRTVENSSLTFSISTGGADDGLFGISSTGGLSFTSVPDYEQGLDDDGDNVYEVLITVSDGVDGTSDVIETINVTVEDVNDNAPEITETNYIIEEGISAVQILARDGDGTVENNSLTFSISTGGADDGLFSISSTGELAFTSVPDYEQSLDADGDNVYEVLVTVSDGVVGTNDISEVVRVTVEDENDNAPMFTSTSYTINEGVSIVQILARDVDGTVENSSLTFSISTGGADDGLFGISSTGGLSFTSVPDYEQVLDDDGDNVYEVLVTVSDGVVGTDDISEVVRVTVEDENDNAPMFTSTGYAVEEGVSMVQVLAGDADGTVENNSLTFSISTGGADDGLFGISSTGGLSFTSVPDYEQALDDDGDNVYEVLVTVSDGVAGTYDISEVVRVTVEDENDNAPMFTSTSYAVEEGVSIVQILARDVDGTVENSSLTFSISTGGADDGLFSIDGSTGELAFTSVPDYEQGLDADGDNVYEVLVTVSDGVVGTNEVIETVRVTVEDENDNAPMFTSTSYTINEGVSIVQILAIDDDGTDENSSLTFSMSTGGADDGLFGISSIGELAFTSVPDYEQAGDGDGDNVYEVLVTVSDGVAGTDDFSEVVRVTVEDENDNAPMFTSTSYTVEEGMSTVQVLAGDADGTVENSSLTFSISTGGADDGLFSISSTGGLSFTSVPDYEQGLDDDGDNVYEVLVTVSDGVVGTDELSEVVRVTVEDVNDNAPMFTSTGYTLEEGVSTVQILARDGDGTVENNSLTFSISTGGADDGLFDISLDGELTFTSVPDYEQAGDGDGDNVYEVLVTVSDGVVGTDELSEVVRVTVEDENDNAPMFTSTSYTIEEGVSIVQILARDGDGTVENSSLTFSISTGGADDGLFGISSTGGLSFTSVPDYEQAMDDDANNVYEVLVTVSDGVVGTDDISEVVRVTVEDENDNAPEFTTEALSFEIEENETNTVLISTWEVLASDADGDDLIYRVSDTTNFEISSEGILFLKVSQDYEFVQSLVVVVTAEDQEGKIARKEVRINISDINEVAGSVINAQSLIVSENTSSIGTVIATDQDIGDNPVYSINNTRFVIDSSSGLLSFGNSMEADYEIERELEVVVTITDGVGSSSALVTIEVADVDDDDVIGGIGFNDDDNWLFSWHDASVAGSFVNDSGNLVSEGSKVHRWLDLSREGNDLMQSVEGNQGTYEDGVMRYALDGSSFYNYNTEARANSSSGLVTFSVVKVKNLLGYNSLFGNSRHYQGKAGDKIFTNNHLLFLQTVEVDGGTQSVSEAKWVQDQTQIIHTLSGRNSQVKISHLSQNDASNSKSIRGDISEVIIFNKEINEAQTVVINNYLGSKWGVNLADNDYYGMDIGIISYKNEVSGLIKLSDSEVVFTNIFGGVLLNNNKEQGAIADDGDAFFVGHNGRAGLVRRWHADFTDASGTSGGKVDLGFSIEDLGLLSIINSYQLIFGSTVYNNGVIKGNNLIFEDVLAGDGIFYLREIGTFSIIKNTFSVEENTLLVGTLEVHDDAGDELSYSTDNTGFSINTMTGELHLVSERDYEADDRDLELTVTISNGSNGSSIETVKVLLADIDEEPIIDTSLINYQLLNENEEGIVGTVEASDPEGESLIYSLDSQQFLIDNNGVISAATGGVDYESTSDGIIELLVTVSDGMLESTQRFEVSVVDMDENSGNAIESTFDVGGDESDYELGRINDFTDDDGSYFSIYDLMTFEDKIDYNDISLGENETTTLEQDLYSIGLDDGINLGATRVDLALDEWGVGGMENYNEETYQLLTGNNIDFIN